MLKNIVRLEHVIGDRMYHMMVDNDSPLNEVKEALFQFLTYVGKIEEQVKLKQEEAAKTAESEVPKVEELEQPKE